MAAFDSDAFDTNAFDSVFDFDSAPGIPMYFTFAEWLNAQPGLSGNINDKLRQYLIALGYSGHNTDMLYKWLSDSGYIQSTLTDRMYAWSSDNLLI